MPYRWRDRLWWGLRGRLKHAARKALAVERVVERLIEEKLRRLVMTEDEHKHRCYSCGVVWSHDPFKFLPKCQKEAHQCPGCGKEEYYRYFGAEPATFVNNGVPTRILQASTRPVMYGGRG